jgi:hypothetical protein
MRNGILSETDGFDLVVNDANRSFRDDRAIAIAAGIYLKGCTRRTRSRFG